MKPIKLILAPLLILLFTGCPHGDRRMETYEGPREQLDSGQLQQLLEQTEARTQIANLKIATLEVKYGLIEARRVMRSPALQELENPNVSSGVNTPTRVWEDQ